MYEPRVVDIFLRTLPAHVAVRHFQ
jgi:hypothetical protein